MSPVQPIDPLLWSEASVLFRDEARPADPECVRRIVESTGLFTPEEVGVAVELVEERLSKGSRSGYHFLFIEAHGTILGYSCFGPISGTESSYDLYWIAVWKSLQGLGLGKRLLAETESVILRMGGDHTYVETSLNEPYAPTRAFYARSGYRPVAELRDFYRTGDHKIIFLKELHKHPASGQTVAHAP